MTARRLPLAIGGVVAALLAALVLLAPRPDDDARLTITRAGADNAKLFAQLVGRLGWPVRATAQRFTTIGDTTAIHVVLAGPTEPTPAERGRILETVRRGAGLLLVAADAPRGSLLDSLGLRAWNPGEMLEPAGLACTPAQNRRGLRDWAGGRPLLLSVTGPIDTATGRPTGARPRGARSLVDVRAARTITPGGVLRGARLAFDTVSALLAFPYGKGRIVVATDGDVVRTDVLRVCEWGLGVAAVRALEYLSPDGRRPVLVAEAYQQRRPADGVTVVVREALVETRPGRTTLALGAAGVLLLAALGRRTLPPLPRHREARRSPLEHVDALATAWARVRGTRTVARQLAAGVRRRHGTARHATLDDAAFLRAIAARHPAVRDEAERLVRALDEPVAPGDLPALRRAAARLDEACLAP